mgnify:CR=1 FL=1
MGGQVLICQFTGKRDDRFRAVASVFEVRGRDLEFCDPSQADANLPTRRKSIGVA